ncbi:MAG TPA: glycosyltransferase family 4 protein [bacterium]|nr:glycosyltransferase family 4 protein [bacterium]
MHIVSLIGNLAGGAGRALVDITRGFATDRQTVLYGHPLGTFSFGLERELDAAGIPHGHVADQAALEQALRELAPDVVLFHWWQGVPLHKPAGRAAPWIMINQNQQPMPQGYDFYVPTSKVNDLLQAHLPAARRMMIYNGIDLARFPEWHKPAGDIFVIGRVSHLLPPKISTEYLDFFAALAIPRKRLLIIGDGPMRPQLAARAAALNLTGQVEFAGELRQDELLPQLRRFDIACHLTDTHQEVFSLAMLELLAMGIPVVTEPKGGLPEQIIHNGNGFISGHRHDHRRYCELLARHPDLRARLSQGARESVRPFTLERQHAAYREAIARCGTA